MTSVCYYFSLFQLRIENRTDEAESRLINHLMKNYDMKRQILPTNNRSKAVVVTFDMAFSLLVDLVSTVGLLTQSRYDEFSFYGVSPLSMGRG